MLLRRRSYWGFRGPQERIDTPFPTDGRGQGWLIARAQCFGIAVRRLGVRVVGLDRQGEAQIGQRVLVTTVDFGRFRQRRETRERMVHLRGCALK